jgi:MFS family permease
MISVNKIIRILILSDVLIYSSWGLVNPVFALFIEDYITGVDVEVAGAAAGMYWITKSLLQVPIGKYLDRRREENNIEKTDYWFVVVGNFVASLTPLILLISSQPWHIYVSQIIFGAAMAMVVPPWGGIFMRHIDKGREAETYALESSALGLGVGAAGIVGGIIANLIGFSWLFIGVSIFGIFGTALLLLIKKNILPPEDDGKNAKHYLRHMKRYI